MKPPIFLLVVLLLSWPFFGRAEMQKERTNQSPEIIAQADKPSTNVDVKLNTPAGQIEVTKQPPPPVIVVPPQPTEKVVVEKQAPPPPSSPYPPPPTGGCHCRLVPSLFSALSLLSLTPVFFFLILLMYKNGVLKMARVPIRHKHNISKN